MIFVLQCSLVQAIPLEQKTKTIGGQSRAYSLQNLMRAEETLGWRGMQQIYFVTTARIFGTTHSVGSQFFQGELEIAELKFRNNILFHKGTGNIHMKRCCVFKCNELLILISNT